MDVGSVGGQQLGDFLSRSAILAGGALLTLLALRTLFALWTLRTGGALQCLNISRIGGQQLGDFLSGSAILASGALLTALTLWALFALWTLWTGGALRTLFALRTGRTLWTLLALGTSRTLFALWKQHIAAIGQVESVAANGQHLVGLFLSDVTHIVHEDTHGNLRILDDRIQLSQVAHVLSIEGIRHAHQLLHSLDGVVVATFGIYFGFQEIGAHAPWYGGKTASEHGPITHLQGHQTIGVGGHLMSLHIYSISVRAPQ